MIIRDPFGCDKPTCDKPMGSGGKLHYINSAGENESGPLLRTTEVR